MGRRHRRKLPQSERSPTAASKIERRLELIRSEFAGPLPAPEILQEYETILPGAADRILTLAEDQAKHRQGLERRLVNRGTLAEILGVIFAFVIGAGGIGAGTFLIY